MAGMSMSIFELLGKAWDMARNTPLPILLLALNVAVAIAVGVLFVLLYLIAPVPRPPFLSEKSYSTTTPTGTETKPLPCWYETWVAHREAASSSSSPTEPATSANTGDISPAALQITLVVPAYNEEARLTGMLEEAVTYLDAEFGRHAASQNINRKSNEKGEGGYEILLVNDGSSDQTEKVAKDFSSKYELHDILRVVTLSANRGKGGAVTHGMRHARGKYAVFADADGASRFADLGKLIEGVEQVVDAEGRGVAVGSRAWLVGSEAVVKRSALRNALMHSFHLLLRLLTPPATSRIRDTQCGFKLFTRKSLPYIIPYMHAEGWIFDVEMLMLAESAGIRVREVPIAWQEVGGSKLNVIKDSLGMAWGLAVLRGAWGLGVWRRR